MADYIDRENAEVAIKEAYDMLLSSDKRKVYEGMNTALNVVHNIPAADVQEVRHGHWENAKGEFRDCGRGIVFIVSATCSVCGRQVNEAYWKGNPPKKTPYCPHCGAKMDESEFAEDTNVLNKTDESEGEE